MTQMHISLKHTEHR